MTTKEKKLLRVMFLLFGLYFLPFKIIPMLYDSFEQEYDKVYKIKDNINRYKRLWVNRDQWHKNHADSVAEWQSVKMSTLQGTTRDIVASKLQDILKQVANKHTLTVRTLALPEFAETAGWLLVTQSMEFEGNSQNLMNFIKEIEQHATRMHIGSLEIRSLRQKKLNANIQVTGFIFSVPQTEGDNDNT